MESPYDAVDLDAFVLTEIGVIQDRAVFRIHAENHDPFDVCVFRQHLVDDLMNNLDGEDWHLGHDDRYIKFSHGDLTLAVGSAAARRYIRETYMGLMYVPMGILKKDAPTVEKVIS